MMSENNITPDVRSSTLGIAAEPSASDPSGPPLACVEIVDASACQALDPIMPKVAPLWWAATKPQELRQGDTVVARVSPTDAGQKVTLDLVPAMLELIAECCGHEDTGEVSTEWEADGEAAVTAVLADFPSGHLRTWRGEPETRNRQAEAVGRAYGLSPAVLAKLTGRPYTPRRSLLPTLSMAKRLAEKHAALEAEAARAKAEEEAARIEAARPKSLTELGIEVIEVARSRAITGQDSLQPYPNALCIGATDSHMFWGFRVIEGLECPAFETNGVRMLRRDETFIGKTIAVDPSTFDAIWARTVRRQHGSGYDTGPITVFTDRGLDRARELVSRWRLRLRWNKFSPDAFRASWLVEALVRGLKVRPDVATRMLVAARGDGSAEHWLEDTLAGECVLAAQRGDISAGALLEPEPAPTLHSPKRITGKR